MSELILSESFVSKYKNKQPNWGFNGLGYIVYKRTYARLKENGKTEEWFETVQRCIEGAQKIGAQYTPEEFCWSNALAAWNFYCRSFWRKFSTQLLGYSNA
jgi:hypothetical protein